MYFVSDRLEYLATKPKATTSTQHFEWLAGQEMNQFQLEGDWKILPEKAIMTSKKGRIRLGYKARSVNIVAASPAGSSLKIFINNVDQKPVEVNNSLLYNLYSEPDVTEHELIIDITGEGFEAFTFTFG